MSGVRLKILAGSLLFVTLSTVATAEPIAPPGDTQLRNGAAKVEFALTSTPFLEPAIATEIDRLSYSIGSTLVQSAGHSWNVSL